MSHITNINVLDGSIKNADSELICIGIYKDQSMTPNGSKLDKEFGGAISSAIEVGDVKGKVGEVNYFYINNRRLAVIGLGKKENTKIFHLRRAKTSEFGISEDRI